MKAYRFLTSKNNKSLKKVESFKKDYLLEGVYNTFKLVKSDDFFNGELFINSIETITDFPTWFIKSPDDLALFSTFGDCLGVFEVEDTFSIGDGDKNIVWAKKYTLVDVCYDDDISPNIRTIKNEIMSGKFFEAEEYNEEKHGVLDNIFKENASSIHVQSREDKEAVPLLFTKEYESASWNVVKRILDIKISDYLKDEKIRNFIYLVGFCMHSSRLLENTAICITVLDDVLKSDDNSSLPWFRFLTKGDSSFFKDALANNALLSVCNYCFKTVGLPYEKLLLFAFNAGVSHVGGLGAHQTGMFISIPDALANNDLLSLNLKENKLLVNCFEAMMHNYNLLVQPAISSVIFKLEQACAVDFNKRSLNEIDEATKMKFSMHKILTMAQAARYLSEVYLEE